MRVNGTHLLIALALAALVLYFLKRRKAKAGG